MPEDQKKSAMDQFLSDIPVAEQRTGEDIFNTEIASEVQAAPEKEEIVANAKDNREARRAKKALQAEREANIALSARIEALTEAQKFARETNVENIDENLKRLYGSDEKGLLAAKITQDLLKKTEEQATERALEAFREEQSQQEQEVASFRAELDEYLEDIEDEFNVDLTSDNPAAIKMRQGFFSLLNKVSPKNKEGIVTDYADPLATWELFQSHQKPENNRAKDLGSRSMVKSGSSNDSKIEQSAQERFLREAGII